MVITNSNPSLAVPARIEVLSAGTTFTPLVGDVGPVTSDDKGELVVEVPALRTVVLRADAPLPTPADAPSIEIARPDDGQTIPTPRYRIQAEVGDGRYAEVTFAVSIDGADPVIVGVDDAPPYRVYWDNAEWAADSSVEVVATVDDGSGRLDVDVVTVRLGDRS